jgi:hypothetical protein
LIVGLDSPCRILQRVSAGEAHAEEYASRNTSATDLSLDDAQGRVEKGLNETVTAIDAGVWISYAGNDMGIDGFIRPPHWAAIVCHYRGGTYAFGK